MSKLIVIDRGWNEIIKKAKSLKDVKIKVGLFGSGSADKNVAYIGAVHEFGSHKKNIPSRPFMAQGFDFNLNQNIYFFEKLYKSKMDANRMVKAIAVIHEAQIKKSIVSRLFWPLKTETIKRKKSSVQLVDTGLMLNSVKSEIER